MDENKFKNKHTTLTPSQQEGLKRLNDWFKDDDQLAFLLYGAAGTGKTYLLKTFLDDYVRFGICVTAPVHQAVRVVEKSTNRKGKTFQSLHGLRPNFNLDDFDINNVKFDTIGQETLGNYKLIVVDESSQISKSLHELNMQRARQYKTKILYVGDMLQLPPITKNATIDRLSPVMNVENKYELTDIVRQSSDNPLSEPLRLLRLDINRQSNSFIDYINKRPIGLNSKDEGYICLNLKDFQESIFKRFKQSNLQDNPNYIRYAAFRNNNISKWNKHLRNMLHNNPNDILIKQDMLLGYNTIVDPNNYMEALIYNSSVYFIKELIKRKSDFNFDVFVLTISDGNNEKVITIVDHKSDTFKNFINQLTRLHKQALFAQPYNRSRFWTEYYNFKNRYLSLIDINLNSSPNRKSTSSKDIDYGYGQTIHKLQGSTIEYIYVNLIDICYHQGDKSKPITNTYNNPYAIEFRNRLIYTAISRASKKAIILI